MTTARDTDRHRFVATVADAAEAVATVLGAHQVRGTEHYPISIVLPVLIEHHQLLQEAVNTCAGPLAVDAAGKQDPFIGDLSGLMSYLQLVCVLYHGLDDIPDSMRVNASRNISALHLAARRVRDQARRRVWTVDLG